MPAYEIHTMNNISRSIHCTATVLHNLQWLHMSSMSRAIHCTLHHDQFTTLQQADIIFNSLHSNCAVNNHMWAIYHVQFNAHCIITYSTELWAVYHDHKTAQQLCAQHNHACMWTIDQDQCTLHTAPRGRYHHDQLCSQGRLWTMYHDQFTAQQRYHYSAVLGWNIYCTAAAVAIQWC